MKFEELEIVLDTIDVENLKKAKKIYNEYIANIIYDLIQINPQYENKSITNNTNKN